MWGRHSSRAPQVLGESEAKVTTTIAAGSLVTVECPVPSELLPHQFIGPEGQRDWVVVAVDGKTLLLGPLRPGPLIGSFECAAGHSVNYQFEIQPTENPPQAQAPEVFVNVAWPLWFLVAVPVASAFLLFFVVRFFYRRHKTKKQKPKEVAPRPVLPADIRYRSFVRDLKARKLLFRQKGSELEETLSQCVKLLRQFLEHRFGFEARAATSSEFLGELKAASIKSFRKPEDARLVHQAVESIFVFTDRVQYSKESPNESQLKDMERQLLEVLGSGSEETA